MRLIGLLFALFAPFFLQSCGGGSKTADIPLDSSACELLDPSPSLVSPLQRPGVQRIINGSSCPAGSPIVRLLINQSFACTGTLIAPNKILTAAHCVVDNFEIAPEVLPPLLMTVDFPGTSLGVYQVVDARIPARLSSDINRVVTKFGGVESDRNSPLPVGLIEDIYNVGLLDLAIVTISKSVPLAPQPILISRTLERDEIAGVFGYGQTNLAEEVGSPTLQSGEMAMNTIGVANVGAFFQSRGSDPCSGDSGGPLLTAKERAIAGVVSLGSSECEIGELAIFTSTSSQDAVAFFSQFAPEAIYE